MKLSILVGALLAVFSAVVFPQAKAPTSRLQACDEATRAYESAARTPAPQKPIAVSSTIRSAESVREPVRAVPATSRNAITPSPAAFAAFIAVHPDEGDVVVGSGGVRKVRWSRAGSGKSGGVRVIYFVRNDQDELVLMFIYAKAKLDTLKASTLKEMRNAIE